MHRTLVIAKSILVLMLCAAGVAHASEGLTTRDSGIRTMTSKFFAADAQQIEVTRMLFADQRLNETVCRTGAMRRRSCVEVNRVLEPAEYACVRQVFRQPSPAHPKEALHTIQASESLREFSALSCTDKPQS